MSIKTKYAKFIMENKKYISLVFSKKTENKLSKLKESNFRVREFLTKECERLIEEKYNEFFNK